MDIKTQGNKIDSVKFQELWNKAKDLTFDDKGLPVGRGETINSIPCKHVDKSYARFLFVKDDATGATCCYFQSKYKTSYKVVPAAYFVRNVAFNKDTHEMSIYLTETRIAHPVRAIITEEISDKLGDALIAVCDKEKNPKLKDVYDTIKREFTLGKAPAGGDGKDEKDDGVAIEDSERVYLLSSPTKLLTKKGSVDAYLIVAPHPEKSKAARGISTLYYALESQVKKKDGSWIDISSAKNLLSKGAVVVSEYTRDANGEMRITYYKEKGKLAKTTLKANDDKGGDVLAWESNLISSGTISFDRTRHGEAVEVLGTKGRNTRPTYKTRRGIAVGLASAVGVALLAGATYHAIISPIQKNLEDIKIAQQSVPYEEDQARAYGAQQMGDRVDNLIGTLLRYEVNGYIVEAEVGNVSNLVKTPVDIYEQKEYVVHNGTTYEGDHDYTIPTVEGAFAELGNRVVKEANEHGCILAVKDDNGNVNVNTIFAAVGPMAEPEELKTADSMIDYLTSIYKDSAVAEAAVNAYEDAFSEYVNEHVASGEIVIREESTVPVVDYTQPKIKDGVAEVISEKTGRSYSANDLDLDYASHDDQVVVATTKDDSYAYVIDLTNDGKDTSTVSNTEEMIEKINNADNCVEGTNIEVAFGRLGLEDSIDNFTTNYAKANGLNSVGVYVYDFDTLTQSPKFENKLEMTPSAIYVGYENGSTNASRVEIRECDTARVKQGASYSKNEMAAASLLGLGVASRYNYEIVKNSSRRSVVYENNDLISAQTFVQSTSKTNDKDRTL